MAKIPYKLAYCGLACQAFKGLSSLTRTTYINELHILCLSIMREQKAMYLIDQNKCIMIRSTSAETVLLKQVCPFCYAKLLLSLFPYYRSLVVYPFR